MPTPAAPPVLTVAEAARRKGCTGEAIRAAIRRGDLAAVRLGPRATVVLDDAAFSAFAVRETGGRTHRSPSVQ